VSFNFRSISNAKTILNSLVAGVYKFELKVIDDKGAAAQDTVQVVVNNPSQSNHPPVANPGPDQTITLPVNTISFDEVLLPIRIIIFLAIYAQKFPVYQLSIS
jgi:hypothetical protein